MLLMVKCLDFCEAAFEFSSLSYWQKHENAVKKRLKGRNRVSERKRRNKNRIESSNDGEETSVSEKKNKQGT